MKKPVLIAAAAGAALTCLTFAPAQAGMSGVPGAASQFDKSNAGLVETVGRRGRRFRRGAAIGAGIVTLGIIGALAAKEARAHRHYGRERHYYRPHHGYRSQCRRWRRWCYNGNDRACWKFDSRC